MKNISPSTNLDLENAILEMEMKQAEEWSIIKQQLQMIHESLQPINLLKSTLEKAATSNNLGRSLLITSAALTTGYLSKKIVTRLSGNPIKKLLGVVLIFGVTRIVQGVSHRIQQKFQE
jgi:hypothetical protein